jgi:hypothetical protein
MMEKTAVNLNYRKATLKDIDLLTKSRIEVLRAANGLSDDADMTEVKHQSYEYYRKALHDSTHTAYLVFNGDRFAGAGGISYYCVGSQKAADRSQPLIYMNHPPIRFRYRGWSSGQAPCRARIRR